MLKELQYIFLYFCLFSCIQTVDHFLGQNISENDFFTNAMG